jgi:hypothetical protein
MKLAIGRIVIFRGDAYNGTHTYPAIITRVHSGDDTANECGSVDLTAFPPGRAPIWLEHIVIQDSDSGAFRVCWPPPIK